MKKLHIIALSMLVVTSAVIMQACSEVAVQSHFEENYDTTHHLNKKRNNNTYDGSADCCSDKSNKHRDSDTHPVCSSCCAECNLDSDINLNSLEDELEDDLLEIDGVVVQTGIATVKTESHIYN